MSDKILTVTEEELDFYKSLETNFKNEVEKAAKIVHSDNKFIRNLVWFVAGLLAGGILNSIFGIIKF